MKTIIKEINLLDIEDVEEALSAYMGKKISIIDVECRLTYSIPMDTGEPSGMYLEFIVDENISYLDGPASFDIFKNDAEDYHYWNGKRLALDEPWIPVNEIFNFDVSAFKSFESWTDSSD